MHASIKKLNLVGQKYLDIVDSYLDRVTSYRLVLYSLLVFVVWAIFGSFIDEVAFNWYEILGSTIWLVAICYTINLAVSRIRNIPRNKESDLITALILALILLPAQDVNDLLILGVAGSVAMLSKYILVYGKRHIFNPAAFGAFSVGLLFDYFPAWWVGTTILVPLVFVAGQLILRKMKRYLMVSVFMTIYLGYLVFNFLSNGQNGDLLNIVWIGLTATSVLFFAYIMLIEPSTSPHKLSQALPYAVLVAILYSVTDLKVAPEEALLIGNLFTFILAPNRRLELSLVDKKKEAKEMYSYIFRPSKRLRYAAGQYMEWTLPMVKADSRGNRRYFTISSSPTEEHLMFTVRQPEQRSSFKAELDKLPKGGKMLAYQLEGSFVLPKDTSKKLVFVAGGIGATPFRSIIKYLLDKQEKRDIILLHSVSVPEGLVFNDLFRRASQVGVTTHPIVSGEPSASWSGLKGQIDSKVIKNVVPDYKERVFYLSGPYGMIVAVKNNLLKMGIKPQQIKTDYFPGYG